MRGIVAVTAALCALAAGCSSGASPGSVDAGGTPIGSGALPIDAGPLPLEGGGSIRSVLVSTNDLVFDPTRGVLYATMNPTGVNARGEFFDAGAEAGNSVITIDPVSATVTGALPVGGLPSVLAISDDGSALYVGTQTPAARPTLFPGVDGSDAVRRIDLASMTVGPVVSLNSNAGGTLTVGQIAAVPGSSTEYLVSRRQPGTPDFAGLALYDGAKLLAQTQVSPEADRITFTDPSTLFGCSNDLSPSELVRLSVTPTAITPGQSVSGLITAGKTLITSNGGWIFATDGKAVNAGTLAAVGTYNATLAPTSPGPLLIPNAVLPDTDGANVWFLRADPVLLDFDRTTFLLRRSISLDPVSADLNLRTGNASALVQWSPTGFAFRTIAAVYVLTLPN